MADTFYHITESRQVPIQKQIDEVSDYPVSFSQRLFEVRPVIEGDFKQLKSGINGTRQPLVPYFKIIDLRNLILDDSVDPASQLKVAANIGFRNLLTIYTTLPVESFFRMARLSEIAQMFSPKEGISDYEKYLGELSDDIFHRLDDENSEPFAEIFTNTPEANQRYYKLAEDLIPYLEKHITFFMDSGNTNLYIYPVVFRKYLNTSFTLLINSLYAIHMLNKIIGRLPIS